MIRAVAFFAAALLAATLGAAQNSPTGTTAGSESTDVNGTTKTVTGCLSSSSLGDNHFKLTDEKGNVYSLAGLTDQLTSHAGQEVRITGIDNSKGQTSSNSYGSSTPSAGSGGNDGSGTGGTSDAGSSASASGDKSLQVTTVQKLADHCSTGSKPAGAEAEVSERPSAQVKLISYKNVGATDDDGTLAGSDGGQSPNQPETSAANSTPDAASSNDLPRTATALPLLGILGLGSLVAGFIVRR